MTGFVYEKIDHAGKITSTVLTSPSRSLDISAEAKGQHNPVEHLPDPFVPFMNVRMPSRVWPLSSLDTVNKSVAPSACQIDNSTGPT